MFGKKGYDGLWYFMILIFGLIGGLVLAIYLFNHGTLTPGMLPL